MTDNQGNTHKLTSRKESSQFTNGKQHNKKELPTYKLIVSKLRSATKEHKPPDRCKDGGYTNIHWSERKYKI